ncbi:MAG: hypothetical protein ACRELT_15140 [Longimicrobiales bacterium]
MKAHEEEGRASSGPGRGREFGFSWLDFKVGFRMLRGTRELPWSAR